MKLYAIIEGREIDGIDTAEEFHGVYDSYEEAHRVLYGCFGIHPDNIDNHWPYSSGEYGIVEIELNQWIQ
jgi:hypothetical protein